MGNYFQKRELMSLDVTDKSLQLFSLDGVCVPCRVVSNYDGDTCIVVFKYRGRMNKFKIRLDRIDTPEIKSRDEGAVEAKDRLAELTRDRVVYLKCFKYEKYGRILGELFLDSNYSNSINQLLLDEGLAREYHGGRKPV